MVVIGITGTNGAGKGTIVNYLVKQKGFTHFSVREFITEEIKRRSLPVNRDSLVMVANDLRTRHTSAYIVEQLFERALEAGGDCIIESIRTPGEVESLNSRGNFHLIAVDADPKIRYERIRARKTETDDISFDEFLENEKREMDSDDPNKQNLSKCISLANYIIKNDDSIESLQEKMEEIIDGIQHEQST